MTRANPADITFAVTFARVVFQVSLAKRQLTIGSPILPPAYYIMVRSRPHISHITFARVVFKVSLAKRQLTIGSPILPPAYYIMVHSRPHISHITFARVVKLADTPDLGSGAVRREGSSPSPSTFKAGSKWSLLFCRNTHMQESIHSSYLNNLASSQNLV